MWVCSVLVLRLRDPILILESRIDRWQNIGLSILLQSLSLPFKIKSVLLLPSSLLLLFFCLSGLSLLLLHFSVLLLHLLHHLLDSESLSFIFILHLLLNLILNIGASSDVIVEDSLFILCVKLPELLEVMVLDEFLAVNKIQVEGFDL